MNQEFKTALATLTRLGCQPKEAGDQWLAFCPVHEASGQGHKPSLTLKCGDTVPVVVNCHAGCAPVEILKMLGTGPAPRPDKPKIVATYPYVADTGELLFEKVRLEPKDFRIRHADSAGGWVWKKPALQEYPLYRLPQVRSAIAEGETVWVCEGEKDVDRLVSLGFCAVCNFEGAALPGQKAKWRKEYTRQLQGAATIVLLPDNDAPGQAHMAHVATEIRRADPAVEILTVQLDRKDVSDWLNAGHTAEELRDLAARATGYQGVDDNVDNPDVNQDYQDPVDSDDSPPPRFQWVQDFCALPSKESWLIRDHLEPDCLAVLYGDSESFKTFLAIDLCAHIATGRAWRGFQTKQGVCAFIAGEGGNGLRKRFKAWFTHYNEPLRNVAVSTVPLSLCDPANVGALVTDTVAFLSGIKPALIVLDTLNAHFGPGDENSTKDMTLFLAGMRALRVATGATVLALHHCGHGAKDRGRGSIALRSGVDWEYRAERQPETLTTALTCTKAKDSDRFKPLAWELETVALPWADEDGTPQFSAVLMPLDAVPVKDDPFTPQQQQALDILRQLEHEARANLAATGHGTEGARVLMSDWQAAMKAVASHAPNRNRLREGLIARKAVVIEGLYVSST